MNIHVSKQESTVSNQKGIVPKLITSKDQILQAYSNDFDGIGHFPGPPYHIQVDPSVTPKQISCCPVPGHLKEPFKHKIDKTLQAGVLKLVHHATPSINSFVLVEGKDKLGKLKLRICFDPTNLNKAIVCEPYHLKTPEDIAICLQKHA